MKPAKGQPCSIWPPFGMTWGLSYRSHEQLGVLTTRAFVAFRPPFGAIWDFFWRCWRLQARIVNCMF